MKPLHFLLSAAFIGLVASRPACAQATIPTVSTVPNAAGVPSIPASGVPGSPGNSTSTVLTVVPGKATQPTGISGPLYSNGLPARDIDAGSQRAYQPRSGQAMSGAQPTKLLHKGRPRAARVWHGN